MDVQVRLMEKICQSHSIDNNQREIMSKEDEQPKNDGRMRLIGEVIMSKQKHQNHHDHHNHHNHHNHHHNSQNQNHHHIKSHRQHHSYQVSSIDQTNYTFFTNLEQIIQGDDIQNDKKQQEMAIQKSKRHYQKVLKKGRQTPIAELSPGCNISIYQQQQVEDTQIQKLRRKLLRSRANKQKKVLTPQEENKQQNIKYISHASSTQPTARQPPKRPTIFKKTKDFIESLDPTSRNISTLNLSKDFTKNCSDSQQNETNSSNVAMKESVHQSIVERIPHFKEIVKKNSQSVHQQLTRGSKFFMQARGNQREEVRLTVDSTVRAGNNVSIKFEERQGRVSYNFLPKITKR